MPRLISVPDMSVYQLANVVSFILFCGANSVFSIRRLGIVTPQDVSKGYPNAFSPAPWTFLMWLPIIISMAAFTGYQSLRSNKSNPIITNIVGPVFFTSNLMGCVWLVAFRYRYVFASLAIVATMMFAWFNAYMKLSAKFYEEPQAFLWSDVICVNVMCSLLASWLSVATTANLFLFASYSGATWFSDSSGYAVAFLVLLGLVGMMPLAVPDFVFPSVIMWSVLGIYSSQGGSKSIAGASITVLAAMLLMSMMRITEVIQATYWKPSALAPAQSMTELSRIRPTARQATTDVAQPSRDEARAEEALQTQKPEQPTELPGGEVVS